MKRWTNWLEGKSKRKKKKGKMGWKINKYFFNLLLFFISLVDGLFGLDETACGWDIKQRKLKTGYFVFILKHLFSSGQTDTLPFLTNQIMRSHHHQWANQWAINRVGSFYSTHFFVCGYCRMTINPSVNQLFSCISNFEHNHFYRV